MKQIVILAKNQQTYFIKRLTEELVMPFVFCNPWNDEICPPKSKVLVRTTGVYGDNRDLQVLRTYDGMVINPVSTLELFRTKQTQYEFFQQMNLPHIPWVKVTENWEMLEQKINNFSDQKFLVKPNCGQGGWGIEWHSLQSLKEWHQRQKTQNDLDYIIQPYWENCREYRIFFIQDEWHTLERFPAKNSVAVNFSQQGRASFSECPSFLKPMIKNLIRNSGAGYGAIDLLVKPGNEIGLLELNAVPGIEQLETVTGINIMSRLISKLL